MDKISTNRQKKEAIVAEVSEKVQRARGMVFANYQGLTHHQLESIKKAARSVEAEFVATKNTLLLRTLKDKNLTDDEKKHFKRPTATLFMYNDVVEPLKQLAKTIKELQMPVVKFAIISREAGSDSAREGFQVLAADQVMRLSTLPPLPVLRAQLLGQMNSPIQGLHRALQWNLKSLVMTLDAIVQKKQ